jgi:hypothetical protein
MFQKLHASLFPPARKHFRLLERTTVIRSAVADLDLSPFSIFHDCFGVLQGMLHDESSAVLPLSPLLALGKNMNNLNGNPQELSLPW